MLPRGWDRRTIVLLAFALPFVINSHLSLAQVFDLEQNRVQMAELNGLWRFHTGDDPRWADPKFDDSSWSLLHSDQSWNQQGYKGYGGYAWYRFKVFIPERHGQLGILIWRMNTTYEIYANGRPIGSPGGMPPHPPPSLTDMEVFAIP